MWQEEEDVTMETDEQTRDWVLQQENIKIHWRARPQLGLVGIEVILMQKSFLGLSEIISNKDDNFFAWIPKFYQRNNVLLNLDSISAGHKKDYWRLLDSSFQRKI